MIASAWVVGLAGLLLGPVGEAPRDQELVQGRWKIVAAETDGKEVPPGQLPAIVVEVKGPTFTVREDGEVTEEATVKLDPTARPAAVEATFTVGPTKGQKVLGIYRLEKDRLTVCLAEPGKERPAEFRTDRGTGHLLYRLERLGR